MKDALYFPHDSNARNDDRMLQVRAKFGIAGYGVYFAVAEVLRDSPNYKISKQTLKLGLSLAVGVDQAMLEQVMNLCFEIGLFVCDENSFWSESLIRRMSRLDKRREMLRKYGKLGGIATAQAYAQAKGAPKAQASKGKDSK